MAAPDSMADVRFWRMAWTRESVQPVAVTCSFRDLWRSAVVGDVRMVLTMFEARGGSVVARVGASIGSPKIQERIEFRSDILV